MYEQVFWNPRETGRRQAQTGVEVCVQMECGDCEMYKPHKLLSVCTQRSNSLRRAEKQDLGVQGTSWHQLSSCVFFFSLYFNTTWLLSHIVVHRLTVNPEAPDSLVKLITVQTFRTSFCCLKEDPLSGSVYTLRIPLNNTACSDWNPASVEHRPPPVCRFYSAFTLLTLSCSSQLKEHMACFMCFRFYWRFLFSFQNSCLN